MTLPRTLILAEISSLAPDHALVPYSRDIVPTKTTVMVRLDEVTPTTERLARKYTAALVLITPRQAPGPADDELDALLEDVLYVVDNAPGLTWTDAKRGTFVVDGVPLLPTYEVTITVHTVHTRGA